jgi:hypothetical protein
VRRVIGRLAQALIVAIAAVLVGRVGLVVGTARGAEHAAFIPMPGGGGGARQGQSVDSTRVRRLLDAARGTNTVACELAANAVDGHSGWYSDSDGGFRPGGSIDSASDDVVRWVTHHDVDATAVSLLRVAIADPDWCVRRLAAPLLGHTRGPAAMQAMLGALASSDAVAREMGALALGIAEDSLSVAPLVARLRDDAPRVRATAAWALGEIERHEAVRPLIDALSDADALVRESAAHALGAVEDTAAIPALTDRLKSDRAATVRRAAARALGEIAG